MANGNCSRCNMRLTKENSIPVIAKLGYGYCNPCRRSGIRDEEQRKQRELAKVLKAQVYEKLGRVCSRCGYSDERALQLDHINGGGRRDMYRRSQVGYFKSVLNRLSLFQILCANCNWIKMHENGEISIHREKFVNDSVSKVAPST